MSLESVRLRRIGSGDHVDEAARKDGHVHYQHQVGFVCGNQPNVCLLYAQYETPDIFRVFRDQIDENALLTLFMHFNHCLPASSLPT